MSALHEGPTNKGLLLMVLLVGALGAFAVWSVGATSQSGSKVSSANTKTGPTGTITIDTTKSNLKWGGKVSFNTSQSGLQGWQYPMISTTCYQDQQIAEINLIKPDQQPELFPSSSTTQGGIKRDVTKSANCVTELDAYGWKSGKESVQILDQVSYDISAL